ncbi:hypothetical protein [Amycolatopsis sp. cmx-4-54]|uniref:hypothetical protein n=1 Tax=Amycolatopsis sp. cmx-4-54 TaxID=2790936 RepID=UPI00397D24D9
MNDRAVRKGRRWRLYRAAVPSAAVIFVLAYVVVTTMREFHWTVLILVALIPPTAVMAVSVLGIQLRNERRLTVGGIAQYQALQGILAANTDRGMLIAREDNVVILPLASGNGVVRFDRDELADATREGRADATVVGDRFRLEWRCPQVTHDFTTYAPLAEDTTDLPPLARQAETSFWSPRGWWRDLRADWAESRSGFTVPSDRDLDVLIGQLRAATT